MMQELLLALLGCDGPIFISSKSHYQIQNGVFSNWEEPLLSRVLELASHYSELLSFCNRCSQGKGRYKAALAAAISDAVQPYKRAVVELERSVLKDESLSVTHVMTTLQPHAPLLSFLAGLVRDVEEGDVHGCKILEVVHQECRSAVHDTSLMNRIEQSVHGVLYDQLTHWLLYGALLDPYKEFFLQPKDCEDSVVGLEPDLLPAHLPAALALAILFVGHAVRDFEAGRSKSSSAGEGLLASSEENFTLQLQALANAKVFSVTRLSDVVHSIRSTVSRHLCQMALDAGLVSAIEQLKSVLLLGRGELYHALLTTAADTLDLPAAEADVNVGAVVQVCGQQVQVQEDLLDNFSFYCTQQALQLLPQVVRDTHGHACTGWSSLCVEYKCSAVLQQVLGCTAVRRQYQQLFAFLLCVKRVQHRLHSCVLSNYSAARRDRNNGELRRAWALRHRVGLLVDGLQYYLQADVLESSQCDLVTSVRDCRDYEQLQCLVASSLASLSSRCFLNHRLVSKCLSLLFSLCHRLCDLLSDAGVANSADVGAAAGAAGGAALQELSSELSSCCSRLFLVLSSMQQLPGQHHTASLLDRLDYNLHYRREQQQRGIVEDSSEASTSLYSNIQT